MYKCTITDPKTKLTFNSTEQFYQYSKAKHFNDEHKAYQIFSSPNPLHCKHLGKHIQGFQAKVWDEVNYKTLLYANQLKFRQNKHLCDLLIDSHNDTFVEANPFDLYWGTGLGIYHTCVMPPSKWHGSNKLGLILSTVRDELSNIE